MEALLLNRIKILKTGLAYVERYLDMNDPENRRYFEELAQPGTELTLRRVKDHAGDPFRIEVFAPDGRFLGRVTEGKNETAARLMDAGLKVVAIVNRSTPVHDSDVPSESRDEPKSGWNAATRMQNGYTDCSLPYALYLAED